MKFKTICSALALMWAGNAFAMSLEYIDDPNRRIHKALKASQELRGVKENAPLPDAHGLALCRRGFGQFENMLYQLIEQQEESPSLTNEELSKVRELHLKVTNVIGALGSSSDSSLFRRKVLTVGNMMHLQVETLAPMWETLIIEGKINKGDVLERLSQLLPVARNLKTLIFRDSDWETWKNGRWEIDQYNQRRRLADGEFAARGNRIMDTIQGWKHNKLRRYRHRFWDLNERTSPEGYSPEGKRRFADGLPRNIGTLGKLEKLDFSFYPMTRLSSEIGSLSNLTDLNLNYNQLEILPKEIGNLKNLKWLNLSYNQLRTLPREIWNLTSLGTLNLSYNQLTELPREIRNLTNLSTLNIAGNLFKKWSSELENLPQLRYLTLSPWSKDYFMSKKIKEILKLRKGTIHSGIDDQDSSWAREHGLYGRDSKKYLGEVRKNADKYWKLVKEHGANSVETKEAHSNFWKSIKVYNAAEEVEIGGVHDLGGQ